MLDETLIETLSVTDEEKPLPEGWHKTKLSELCSFIRGVSFDKSAVSNIPKDNHLAILRAGNIQNSLELKDDLIWIPSEFVSNYQKLIVKDIAVCMSSGSPSVVGKTAQLREDFEGSVGAFCGIIRPNNIEQADYIAYWLKSPFYEAWRDKQTRGANIQNLRFSEFESITIPLPPTMEEQKRIASILDEQVRVAEEARRAVEEQLEAANLLPNAFMRSVFESEETHNWQKRQLSEMAKTCSGSTPSRGNPDYYRGIIPWVKTGELKDGLILETEEHISELALKETSLKLLPPETLLVAMYGQGQTRGRTGLLTNSATTNQACFAILPNETFDSYFLQYWFRHNYQRLRQESEGRGGNQPNLNGDVLNKQIISLPSQVTEQRKIAERLKEQMQAVEPLKQSLIEKLKAINKLPAALLRKAFAGEI